MIAYTNVLGNNVPLMLIFPRISFKEDILKSAPHESIGCALPSGWSNVNNFPKCLKHFISREKPNENEKLLLIPDNHESHITVDGLTLAKDNGIILRKLPPHSSHKLQSLHESIFSPYETFYNTACAGWLQSRPGKPVTIYDVPEIAG
ncbi:uncharacterized protein LOC126159920 [Schistocerca cancellata]|uniref:uncharacterized protein LOC126159920 n=1 Tax=Schistocerca cancellata TaxID=274614 RepID=UPI0021194125|nr:uncharacterized protein LOC126159920 [Schistocerca cancellata]